MAALEAKDDACKFLIMDIVVFFRREEAPQVEGDWVHAIVVFLGNNDPQGVSRRVGVHDEGSVPVGSL